MSDLKRIAVLVRSLDDLAAEAVLTRLPDDVRESVVQALNQLDPVSAPDSSDTACIEDFVGGMRRVVQNRIRICELDESDLESATFEKLVDAVSMHSLADLVRDEHPQTCAIVVAGLSPDRAAELLQEIAAENRADVLRRVLELEDADSGAVTQLQDLLATKLRTRVIEQRKEDSRLQRVQAILGAADPQLRDDLLGVIQEKTPIKPSCEKSRSPNAEAAVKDAVQTSVNFDRLVDCNESVIQALFAELPVEVTSVALAGASLTVRNHVFAHLSDETTSLLNQRFANPDPIRVADIHIAQAIVLRLLERYLVGESVEKRRIALSV